MTVGCFILALRVGQNVEAITMHKFQKAVSIMISKEGIFSLHLRYLTVEERSIAAEIFEYNK